jgi:hydrogenase maturation protease
VDILKQKKHLQQYIPALLSVEKYDRPGLRLLELMKDSNKVFLIDAVVTGNSVGTLYRLENEEIEELKCILSTHGIGVAQVLQLGKAINQIPHHLIFYGIEINNSTFSSDTSPLIEATIQRLVEHIEAEIINIFKI